VVFPPSPPLLGFPLFSTSREVAEAAEGRKLHYTLSDVSLDPSPLLFLFPQAPSFFPPQAWISGADEGRPHREAGGTMTLVFPFLFLIKPPPICEVLGLESGLKSG